MARLRRAFVILLSLALLSSCAQTLPEEDHTLHILATTYPVYLFTTAVVGGAKNVEVELLVNSQTSCLHDYTLTVKDMKTIEGADVIIMNGAGMEEFMADASASPPLPSSTARMRSPSSPPWSTQATTVTTTRRNTTLTTGWAVPKWPSSPSATPWQT